MGTYLFARHNNIYYIKLSGKVNYTVSPDLNEFLKNIFDKKDFENIVIDLSETEYLDSTNLGVLLKIEIFVRNNLGVEPVIYSTNEKINKLLSDMGLDKAFVILNKPSDFKQNMEEMPHIKADKNEMGRVILEAHKFLIELNEENKDKFENVIKHLKKSMKKNKTS